MPQSLRTRIIGRPGAFGQTLIGHAMRVLGHAKPAKAKRRKRDFQRAKVYAWERVHVHKTLEGKGLPLAECQRLVEEVFRTIEQPLAGDQIWQPPRVTDGRGRRHACGSRSVIKLPRWSRHHTIVLHECAHGLSDDGHGPEFMRQYIDLLAQFAAMDPDALSHSAHKAGVRIAQ